MLFPGNIFNLLLAYQVYLTNNGAILVYSGTPASGNLVASFAGVPGTDIYGNSYLAGLTTYFNNGTPNVQVENGFEVFGSNGGSMVGNSTTTTGTSPSLQFTTSVADIVEPGIQEVNVSGSSNQLVISGPANMSDADQAVIKFLLQASTGTNNATAAVQYSSATGTVNIVTFGVNGADLIGNTMAAEPGVTPLTAETWHAVTPAAGWSTTGLTPPLQYQLTPNNTVRVEGDIKYSTGTPSSGSVMCTLPAGYRPSTTKFSIVPVGSMLFLVEIGSQGNIVVVNFNGNTLGATPIVQISYEFPLGI